jgi:hypothetical protein
MENKTHYRKVAKSDHLGTPDLEDMTEKGHDLILTISHVNQEYGAKVAGKKIDANIAYFKDVKIKPLVLNATNAKVLKGFASSPFVEDWKDLIIQLYLDANVMMKGEKVGGVRIRPIQPVIKKALPNFTESNFEKAKEAGASLDKIKTIYSITPEMSAKYSEYVK